MCHIVLLLCPLHTKTAPDNINDFFRENEFLRRTSYSSSFTYFVERTVHFPRSFMGTDDDMCHASWQLVVWMPKEK